MNCLACGSIALVSGTVLENSGGGTTMFMIDETSIWKSMFGVGTRKIRAYGCVHCRNLQFTVDFSEKDVRRYQQFEGEQPGVIERISAGEEDITE